MSKGSHIAVLTFVATALGAVPATANLLPNSSVEVADDQDATVPQHWGHNAWGENKASFDYLDAGCFEGDRCLRIEVSGYGSGDAKWWSDFVDLPEKGGIYRFWDSYRSNVATTFLIGAQNAAGDISWINVQRIVAPSSTWTLASDVIELPPDTVRVRVAHLLQADGWLETDSFGIADPMLVPDGMPVGPHDLGLDPDHGPAVPREGPVAGLKTHDAGPVQPPRYSMGCSLDASPDRDLPCWILLLLYFVRYRKS